DEGRDIFSCIVLPSDALAKVAGGKLTDRDRIIKHALANLLCESGVPCPQAPTGTKAVRIDEWRERAYREGFGHEDTPEARKKAFQRAREKLISRGEVGNADGWAWLVNSAGQAPGQPGQGTPL